mmetsp:Transcript_15066/g.17203  ORF Transcript_15066/g.17203 Transcript_15066/m.17203 type:complete len:393 (-) Transcript_15066:166-1344(-)
MTTKASENDNITTAHKSKEAEENDEKKGHSIKDDSKQNNDNINEELVVDDVQDGPVKSTNDNAKEDMSNDASPQRKKRKLSVSDTKDEEEEEVEENSGDETASQNAINSNDIDERIEPIVDLSTRTVTFPTYTARQHLLCSLCDGLFRDPFTISECLHTFCKSCIFFAYDDLGIRTCPKCDVKLGPDPFQADRTIQELVDTLFPELKKRDIEMKKEYLKKLDEKRAECPASIAAEVASRFDLSCSDQNVAEDNCDCAGRRVPSLRLKNSPKQLGDGKHCGSKREINASNYVPAQDEINLSLYPSQGEEENFTLPPLEKPLLQTSGRLKIIQIKKFILSQLKLKNTATEAIDVRCNGDRVGDELSLTFILKTRWLHPTEDLKLHYGLDCYGMA